MMVSLPFFNRRFTPKWSMAFVALLFFTLFCRLGFWQLERAEQKKQMLLTQQNSALKPASTWFEDRTLPQQYERISLSGSYLPDILLLDNQHHQHQFGYDVLSPLALNNGRVILIDRGWVAASAREQLPTVTVPRGKINLSGYAYYPSEKNWVLGQVFEKKQANVTIVERIDTKLIGQLLHKSTYPFIIRLDKDKMQDYVRDWAIVSMPPERHYAYALQWFAMAAVILILFIALNLKKSHDNV